MYSSDAVRACTGPRHMREVRCTSNSVCGITGDWGSGKHAGEKRELICIAHTHARALSPLSIDKKRDVRCMSNCVYGSTGRRGGGGGGWKHTLPKSGSLFALHTLSFIGIDVQVTTTVSLQTCY